LRRWTALFALSVLLPALAAAQVPAPAAAQAPAPAAAQHSNPFGNCLSTDAIRSGGMQAERIPNRPNALLITRTGGVHIACRDTALWADRVVIENDTNRIEATGNVLFQQADLQIFAERADLNGATKLGTFYQARGRAGLGAEPEEKSLFGTHEPHIIFEAERIEKAGEGVYKITNATFTTCMQAAPRWAMSGSNGTIAVDRYTLLRNVVLRVKNVPLLYLPAIYYPINKEDRATGFLLPSYGSSSVLGSSISNAFFWAVSRSQDATFYHDWYPKGGQGLATEYRYAAAPGSEGRARLHLLQAPELGRGDGTILPSARYLRIDGSANHALPRGFRFIGEGNFFTDVASQQLHQDVYVSSRPERFLKTTLMGTLGRSRLSVMAEQRDYFFGTSSSAQRTGRAPFATLNIADTPLGRSRVYAGFWAEGGRVVRQDNVDDPATDRSLWRIDAAPSVRLPLSRLPYLSAQGSASWRLTHWSESRDPLTGAIVPVMLTRQLLETRVSAQGPTVSRVFSTPGNGYAERFKHLIEPSVVLDWRTPFDRLNRVVQNDAVDQAVGGDVRVNYRLDTRLLARLKSGGSIREILSASIGQTYYTNTLAAAVDPQYQTTTPSPYSPVQIKVIARPADRASGQFDMEFNSQTRAIQAMSATGMLHGTYAQLNAGWDRRTLPGSSNPVFASHNLNATFTLRTRDNRAGGTYSTYYDLARRTVQRQRFVTYYNSQCCGIAFDWQSVGGQFFGVDTNRTWGVSFTLAGIGSFSNPLGSFGGR